MYKLWPRQTQFMTSLTFIWRLWPWPSTYLKKCFKWHFSSSRTTAVQNYFWNPCINVQVLVRTSSIYDHFDLYLTPVTLTFNLPEKCFRWHFSSSRATSVQNYFLKSIHKCTSYGPDKLNIWPFWPLFDPCDLDLKPTWKNVSNGTFPLQRQQLCNFCLKSMHKCTSYGPDKLNIWLFWPLFDPCDLDLQPTWNNVSNDTFPFRGQQLWNFFFESHT